jgi:transposase
MRAEFLYPLASNEHNFETDRGDASFCVFKMFKTIKRPAACKMRFVILLLNARNVQPGDIHRELCEVYGENATSDSIVRRWARNFSEGRGNVHDEQRSGRPSVVNDDLVRAVEENVRENRRFTISSLFLHLHFPRNCVRSLGISEVVFTLGAKDSRPHTAAKTQEIWLGTN